MAMTMIMPAILSGCGKKDNDTETTKKAEETTKETEVDSDNFVELTLAVLYNDTDKNYFENEFSDTIKVSEEGQYTLEFDCEKNLSDDAKANGIDSLKNLTAIYIIDYGSIQDQQSTITACDIKYDSVVVNDTELTINKTEAKSALKDSGIFDTNDPINSWDGSAVEEVEMTGEHVANFTTIDNPTKISVTFTLSNMTWGSDDSEEGDVVASTNTYVNEAVFSDIDFTDVSSVDLTKYLGNGINLGNTMEAVNSAYGKDLDVSSYEQAWGQPVTTEEMIIGMKNCGFDTLRIPVAWTNMMDYENEDYTINTAYLDRIQEIVDWAIKAEMFVIVNDHWDGGWWEKFGKSDEEEQAWKIYESIWTQVSERFKDYSDMLILESANEELGRGWQSQGLDEDECYEMMNKVNQKFVDIVRNSGGNNDDRFLLIAGDNTNIGQTLDERFVMPTDTAKDKLFVSVHFYDPTSYCLDKDNYTQEMVDGLKWGLKGQYKALKEELDRMTAFVDKGYGVIIGEYGALPAYIDGTVVELPNTIDYTCQVLDVCDLDNFCPVLWSTGAYDKKALNMISDEQTELYTSRCYAEEIKSDTYLDDVKTHMKEVEDAAPEKWAGQETYEAGEPVAWIMWNGGAGTYSVGDTFNAADNTEGITATNTVVDGAGEYEVSLDFAGGNDGITFTALAIADGEILYPGCLIDIKEITLDGEPIELGKYYTASDDDKCTRVNLYNSWCGDLQQQVEKEDCNFRTVDGDLSDITATPVDPTVLTGFNNITIKFELIVPEE